MIVWPLVNVTFFVGQCFSLSAPSPNTMQPPSVANPFSPQQPAYSPAQAMYAAPTPGSYVMSSPTQMPFGGFFPSSTRPAVPARSGAMRPPVAQQSSAQDPFGGGHTSPTGILAPTNLQPDLSNDPTNGKEEKPRYDPFASLLPGMGGSTDKKNMFKDFKMASPVSKTSTDAGDDEASTNQNPALANPDPFASFGLTNDDKFDFGNQVNFVFFKADK